MTNITLKGNEAYKDEAGIEVESKLTSDLFPILTNLDLQIQEAAIWRVEEVHVIRIVVTDAAMSN